MKLIRPKEGYRKVGDKYLLAKKCTKCGRWLVASTVNFYKNKASKCGLESYCKECKKGYDKQWQQANRDRKAEHNKQYHKQWYEANKEKDLERQKQWRENNSEYNKQYYEANLEYYKQYHKQYRQSPQGQVVAFNARNKRRLREQEQGTGITNDQWLEMMKFFGFRCAYSGETLSKDTRSVDHIVPLNSNGDNMIWNCVPMKINYNSSKSTKDMLEWYREQDFYSEARLAKIYEWQEYARKKWKK